MARSDALKLYGTEQPISEKAILEAGPVTLELHGGTVRYVRYRGHEAIRGVDYLVRDDSWRTPPAKLTSVRHEQHADGFTVELDGEVEQDDIHYRYRLALTGNAQGRIEVRADAEAITGFSTNRTGFVVLHPVVGVAGAPVRVTHKDGSTSETTFPELISPGQPIFDIRALRHKVTRGVYVTCLMEAQLPHDPETIYEMEDQRNWTDASYKTYVGSLLDPWPYRIEAGQKICQRVVLTFEVEAEPQELSAGGALAVRFGDGAHGKVPSIGLGVMADYRSDLVQTGHPARKLKPQFVTAYVECDDPEIESVLADYQSLSEAYDASVQLELVLPEGQSPGAMLRYTADLCTNAGLSPARVIVCPRAYLKSAQPVGPWPEVFDLAHIYNMARHAFPDAVIMGGMLSYFTELNRKRPPISTVDAVTCTTTPIVHAADDQSVMETLEALPSVILSMQAMAAGKPLHLGPSAIGMRHNPYGAATANNPNHERIAMAENDPRQAGLFAAAWAVGYAAAVANSEAVSTLCLNHLAGPSGVCAQDGTLYPVYHVMRALCDAGEAPLVPVTTEGAGIAGLAWGHTGSQSCLIANLTPEPTSLKLRRPIEAAILDGATFEIAASDAEWTGHANATKADTFELGGLAVLFGKA